MKEVWEFHYIAILWTIFAVSVIYWDIQRQEDKHLVSACHGAEIKVYHNKNICTECKLFCKIKETQ